VNDQLYTKEVQKSKAKFTKQKISVMMSLNALLINFYNGNSKPTTIFMG